MTLIPGGFCSNGLLACGITPGMYLGGDAAPELLSTSWSFIQCGNYLKKSPYEEMVEKCARATENDKVRLRSVIQSIEGLPFCTKILRYEEFSDNVKLLMHMHGNETFHDILSQNRWKDCSVEERLKALIPVAVCLEEMHARGVCHQDVKPSNVFLESLFRPFLGDFNSAVCLKPYELIEEFKGTFLYMAPEILQNQPHGLNCDCWSFGCMLVEGLSGKHPFMNIYSQLDFKRAVKGNYRGLDRNPLYSYSRLLELKSIIDGLLTPDHDKRASMSDFLKTGLIQEMLLDMTANISDYTTDEIKHLKRHLISQQGSSMLYSVPYDSE